MPSTKTFVGSIDILKFVEDASEGKKDDLMDSPCDYTKLIVVAEDRTHTVQRLKKIATIFSIFN